MSLEEGLRLVENANRATRLLVLDDLWTAALRSDSGQPSETGVIDIGAAMLSTFNELRGEVPWLRDVALRDPVALQEVAEQALAQVPLSAAHKDLVRYIFQDRGWAGELRAALDELAAADDAERELVEQLAQLSHGDGAAGDFKPSVRGTLLVVAAGVSLAAAVVTAPVSGPLGVTALVVGGPIVGLGVAIGDLFERKHDADVDDRVARLEANQRDHERRWAEFAADQKAIKDRSEDAEQQRREFERQRSELQHQLAVARQEIFRLKAGKHRPT
jgi:hypothetical protein